MKKTISKEEFIEAFDRMGRGGQFSVEAREAMFNYFEEMEADAGMEMELDVIAVCCGYTEYESIADYNVDYGHFNFSERIEDIEAKTTVIPVFGDKFVIQSY
jgi:hypothetical protein